jgi:hypothetical protein
MFGEKDSQFRNSASMNNATFNDYMYRFMKIATSIFEWENLPESCSAEYLEYCLYAYGSAAFFGTVRRRSFYSKRFSDGY